MELLSYVLFPCLSNLFSAFCCRSELSTTLPPGVSVGNVLLFNQPHPTCQSAFIIHQMGPDAASLTPCLVDSNYKVCDSNSVEHFRKVYFDVWDLKLEILTCFDAVFCHLHGVTFKNIYNTLKTI